MVISRLIHVTINGIISFLWLSNIPVCVYAIYSLSIHLSMDIQDAPMFGYCK